MRTEWEIPGPSVVHGKEMGVRTTGGGHSLDCMRVRYQPKQPWPRSGGQVLFGMSFFMEADVKGTGCLSKQ